MIVNQNIGSCPISLGRLDELERLLAQKDVNRIAGFRAHERLQVRQDDFRDGRIPARVDQEKIESLGIGVGSLAVRP